VRGADVEDGDAPTRLEEDSAFPVGGFASLATTGSLENLVTSELMYLDQGADQAERPDLFDVRFVEGELLYYSRDESVAVRRRRAVVLVLDASLVQARVLDPGESWQRLVWLLGSVAAMVRRLAAWQDTDALGFEVVFLTEGGQCPLAEERDVCMLLLREFRERGQLELSEATSAVDAARRARAVLRQRAQVIHFTARAPGLEAEALVDAVVEVGGPRPVLHWHRAAVAAGEVAPDAATAWVTTTRLLLEGLLRSPRSRVGAGAR
jgi:hypothetical protein